MPPVVPAVVATKYNPAVCSAPNPVVLIRLDPCACTVVACHALAVLAVSLVICNRHTSSFDNPVNVMFEVTAGV